MNPASPQRRPLPARVYWVRRCLVLAVALAMVFGVARLLGDTGSDAAAESARVVDAEPGGPAHSPTARSTADSAPATTDRKAHRRGPTKTRTPLAEPSGPCDDDDIVVTPKVKGSAHAGSPVTFRLKLTTLESPACSWQISSSTLVVKLVSGSDRIWSSQDCPGAIPSAEVVVRKDHAAKLDFRWRGRRSDSSCSNLPDWAQPGWYHVQAAAFGAEPTDELFELLPVVQQTITAKPKPEPKQKSARGPGQT